jgi:hypothetical protein
MATTHGKDGQVRVGANQVGSVTQWTLTFNPDYAKTVYLGDSYKSQIGGVIDATGTINVDTDSSDTNGQVALQTAVTGQTTARLYLYINTTAYWEFNANLALVDTVSIGDVVKRVLNYMSNGTVTAPS